MNQFRRFLVALAIAGASPLPCQVRVAPDTPRPSVASDGLRKDVAALGDDKLWWGAYTRLLERADRGQPQEVLDALLEAYRDVPGEPNHRMRALVRTVHAARAERVRKQKALEHAAVLKATLAALQAATDPDVVRRELESAQRALAALEKVLEKPEVTPVIPEPGSADDKGSDPAPAGDGKPVRLKTKDGRDVIVTPPPGWRPEEMEAEFKENGLVVKRKKAAPASRPAPQQNEQKEQKERKEQRDDAPTPDPIGMALDATRPRPEEERWRTIPWHESLTAALARATREGKPVFLFGVDGVLDSGYC